MARIKFQEELGVLSKVSSTQIKLTESRLNIGGSQYRTTSDIFLNTGTTGVGGLVSAVAANTTYYVHAVLSNDSVALIGQTASTVPAGYTASKIVGKFSTNGSSQVERVNPKIQSYILG